MEWRVKIFKEDNQRVRVVFKPLEDTLYFFGEFKPYNKAWEIFSQVKMTTNKLDLEIIQERLEETIALLKKRCGEYDNIAEGFSVLKEVEYVDDINQ